jgi:hypothetical protein
VPYADSQMAMLLWWWQTSSRGCEKGGTADCSLIEVINFRPASTELQVSQLDIGPAAYSTDTEDSNDVIFVTLPLIYDFSWICEVDETRKRAVTEPFIFHTPCSDQVCRQQRLALT